MRKRYLWLVIGMLVAAMSLTAAGSAGVSHSHATKVKNGGTVTFGAEQEPVSLNTNLACCNLFWAAVIVNPVLSGVFHIQPNFTYKPNLVASYPKITNSPFTVTYVIKKNAKWSDGAPITAQDFIFTWKTIVDPKNDVASREGYNQITGAKVFNSKKVRFKFAKPYADWRDLFGQILPQHALQGEDFNNVWKNDIDNPKKPGSPLSSGPFMVQSWQRGSQLTLVRNPRWFGAKAHLSKIVFRFLTDTNTEIQAVRGHEVDAIYPQPQFELADLRKESSLSIQSNAGTTYEHIDIQQGEKGNPLAKNLWARQALAYSVNRAALVKALFRTLNPSLKPLGNVLYLPNQKQYKSHFNFTYSTAKVAALMKAHGCTKGSDGIYSCGGTRFSFKMVSTAGNRLRETAFEIMQAQAKAAGVELQNGFEGRGVFGRRLATKNYELFMFAWVGSPDPAGSTAIWKCNGDSNFMDYCDTKVSRLLDLGDVTLNAAKRTAIINQADAQMAKDLPTIPLYQKPTFLVFSKKVHGMRDNPTLEGPTWNTEAWWKG